MFFKQMIEDFSFDDLKNYYKNDKYFIVPSEKYDLNEIDLKNFNTLLNSIEPFKTFSLDVITMKKDGIYPRIWIMDQEDELKPIKKFSLEELSSFPVDMFYSKDATRALRMIIVLLMEFTFYRMLEDKTSNSIDIRSLGGINISTESEIEEQ